MSFCTWNVLAKRLTTVMKRNRDKKTKQITDSEVSVSLHERQEENNDIARMDNNIIFVVKKQ
ncbi:MAG: hypothetical protein HDQ95_05210 [Roseburia sp.]|nr:hypothetical protein [Roseburia sp.]